MENQDSLDEYYKNKGGCDVKGVIIFMSLATAVSFIIALVKLFSAEL
jgi:hypothetical protein